MGPRRATPPQRAPSSKVSTPSEPPTPKKEVFNGLFGGLDLTFDGGPKFGPDGEPLEHNATGLEHTFGQPNEAEVGDMEHTFGKREKVELKTTAWYHADSGRQQLEYAAQRDLQAICETVEEMKARGRCLTGKFTNDPEILPDRKFPEVLPFPPEMAQLMLRRQLDEDVEDEDLEEPTFPGYTAWHRLSERHGACLSGGQFVAFGSCFSWTFGEHVSGGSFERRVSSPQISTATIPLL